MKRIDRSAREGVISSIIAVCYARSFCSVLLPRARRKQEEKSMTVVGFEPTPQVTSTWNWRLRPLGHTVCRSLMKHRYFNWTSLRRCNKHPNCMSIFSLVWWIIPIASIENSLFNRKNVTRRPIIQESNLVPQNFRGQTSDWITFAWTFINKIPHLSLSSNWVLTHRLLTSNKAFEYN